MTGRKKPRTPSKPPAEPVPKVKIKPDARIGKIVDRGPGRPPAISR